MRRSPRFLPAASIALLSLALGGSPAVAASGDPDPAYGTEGKTTIDARPGTRPEPLVPYRAQELPQPGGGLIVTGQTEGEAVFVAKYTEAGQLDPTFGTAGITLIDLGPSSYDEPGGLTLDTADRIVIAGRAGSEAFLARLTTTGQLDTSFAGDGILVHPTPGDSVSFSDVVVDADDGMYVATSSAPTTVRRYTAAGALDTSFGISGVSTTDQFGDLRLGLDPNTGRVIIGGDQSGNSYRFARLQGKADASPGSFDTTFSGDGQLDITSPQAPGTFKDLDVASDGTIAVVGTTATEGYTVIRLSTAGEPSGLDGDGVITSSATASSGDEPIAISAIVSSVLLVAGASGSTGGFVQEVVASTGATGSALTNGCETGSTCTPIDFTTLGGTFYLVGTQAAGPSAYVAARLGSTGAPKTSFNGDGFNGLTRNVPWGLDVVSSALDGDGNLTTLGLAGNYNDESSFLLRQGPTGGPIASFGAGGVALSDLQPSASENAAGVALPDGSWLLAPSPSPTTANLTLRRMTGSGLDGAFGVGGTVTIPIALAGNTFQALALAVDSQGRVVAAGSEFGPGGGAPRSAVIVRILPQSGIIDPNFNGGAPKRFDNVGGSNQEQASSVKILSNGDIVAGGVGGNTAFVIRLDGSGASKPGFGDTGYALLPGLGTYSSGNPVPVAVGPTGEILVGTSIVKAGTDREIAIGRLTATGALDTTFGTSGVATVAPADTAEQVLKALTVDNAGRIVFVGRRTVNGIGDSLVARLTTSGQPDADFAPGGRVIYDLAAGNQDQLIGVHMRGRRILTVGSGIDPATGTGRVLTLQLLGDPDPPATPAPTPQPTPTPELTPTPTPLTAPVVSPAITTSITPRNGKPAGARFVLRGTATAAGGTTTKVEVAIRQVKKGTCRALRSATKPSFAVRKPFKGACTKPIWLPATGTTNWSLTLARGLPTGSYEIQTRGTLSTGLTESSFVSGRNLIVFRVR